MVPLKAGQIWQCRQQRYRVRIVSAAIDEPLPGVTAWMVGFNYHTGGDTSTWNPADGVIQHWWDRGHGCYQNRSERDTLWDLMQVLYDPT